MTTRKQLETMTIIHFADVKFYWSLCFNEIETKFGIPEKQHIYNIDIAINILQKNGYTLNSEFLTM